MPERIRRVYLRKAKKLGNSAGVLLPKSLLGADVKVILIHPPINIKRDVIRFLEAIFEEIIGIYLISKSENKIEVIAISTNIEKTIEKGKYSIKVIPIKTIRELIKNKSFAEKFSKSEVIINKQLLAEIRKSLMNSRPSYPKQNLQQEKVTR